MIMRIGVRVRDDYDGGDNDDDRDDDNDDVDDNDYHYEG
jgi:hypothetical protein